MWPAPEKTHVVPPQHLSEVVTEFSIMVAVYGDFVEGPGMAFFFHISFANDRVNDGETYTDEVASGQWPT